MAVGIDLGTTYSSVGVWKNEGVEIIANEHGDTTMLSYVTWTDTDMWVGGGSVEGAPPENTIFDAKRMIGRRFADPEVQEGVGRWPFKVEATEDGRPLIAVDVGGKDRKLRPEDITTMQLKRLREVAEAYLGRPVTQAVITVPAKFNDGQRQATRDAAAAAGLKVLRTINEPMAAAVAYELDRMTGPERNVLVFDMGGGSCNVSLLGIEDGIFEIKAAASDGHLGGRDIDERILEHCVQDFQRKHPGKDLAGNKAARARLLAACERGKRVLSHAMQASIEVEAPVEGVDYSCTLSRARFAEMNIDLFRRALRLVEKCLRDAEVEKEEIYEVLLVGGSSRIPKVQRMLQDFFDGKELCMSVPPEEVVATGAALVAAMLSSPHAPVLDQGLPLWSVTLLDLGIETAGGVMTTVVRRNTTLPLRRGLTFTTCVDNQQEALIRVFQGTRALTEENLLVGQIRLPNIPPAPRGEARIEVIFDIDANEVLRVTARESSIGYHRELTVGEEMYSPPVDELERLVREGQQFAAEDEVRRREVEAEFAAEVSRGTAEGHWLQLYHGGTESPVEGDDTVWSALEGPAAAGRASDGPAVEDID